MATIAPRKVPIPRNGVDYRGKVVLAPMVRSGECPARLTALTYGADLVWGKTTLPTFGGCELITIIGPETIDRSMIGTTRRVCPRTNTILFGRFSKVHTPKGEEDVFRESIIYRIHPEREKKQLIFQIGTSNPETAVQAATLVAGDVSGIDVNAGCPKPFSTTGGMGAALLKTPDLLCSILEALVKEVGTPYEIGISVKIRILQDPKDTEALVRRLVKTGIIGLTVHCRTTPMRPRERAIRDQLRMVGNICREAGVACLMNGDVVSRDQAMALMQEYGVDGAMIATAAEKNPSVFRSEAHGPVPWQDRVRTYLDYALSVENRWGNTKFSLAQIVPASKANVEVSRLMDHEQVVRVFGFDDMLERAKQLDNMLGLHSRIDRKAAKRAAAEAAAALMEEKKAKQKALAKREVLPDDLPGAMPAAIAV
jgi:tRNA-dihydrouridine synthase 2